MNIFRNFGFFLFSLSLASVTAQETAARVVTITAEKPSWQTVIGGTAVAAPCQTSYGFAVSCDGRLLSACTEKGTIIWQKSIQGKQTPYMAAASDDFLYSITDDNHLSLINPSGLTLWEAACPFQVTGKPLPGRDGRVFVFGKQNAACYGCNGILKWTITTDRTAQIPPKELNDGSLLIFLADTVNNQTVARRYSPFGDELEKITFSGIVLTAVSCKNGVLIVLSSGACGLCAVTNGAAESLWLLQGYFPPSQSAPLITVDDQGNSAALVFEKNATIEVTIINSSTGSQENQFSAGNGSLSGFTEIHTTESGFFIAAGTRAFECSKDGTLLWSAELPSQKTWSYLIYTKQGYLVLCMNNWVLDGYRMNQLVGTVPQQAAVQKSYCSFYQTVFYSGTETDPSNLADSLRQGNYGKKEQKWMSMLLSEMNSYLSERTTEESFQRQHTTTFDDDPLHTVSSVVCAGLTGTDTFVPVLSELIPVETDPSLQIALITAAGSIGFDPDGQMLASLEYVLHSGNSYSSSELRAVCDSVYSICRFMGRPAFFTKGKIILGSLVSSRFDNTTRSYARMTMVKLLKLGL